MGWLETLDLDIDNSSSGRTGFLLKSGIIQFNNWLLYYSLEYFKILVFCVQEVQNNGSLYIHVYFVKTGYSPDPLDEDRYSRKDTVYKWKRELLYYCLSVFIYYRAIFVPHTK